jgi:hypothetical protein
MCTRLPLFRGYKVITGVKKHVWGFTRRSIGEPIAICLGAVNGIGVACGRTGQDLPDQEYACVYAGKIGQIELITPTSSGAG